MSAGAAGRRSTVRRAPTGEGGYAMAALLVGLAVMAVVMTMAMPVWSTVGKRAREDELVFRGEQYARAIGLYQRKYANALPPSIDVLINEKFLRRKYLDPVTGGEFQALTGSVGQAAPGVGGAGGAGVQTGIGRAGAQASAGAFGRGGMPASGGAPGSTSPRSTDGLRGLAQQTGGAPVQQTGSTFGGGLGAGAGGIVGVASKSTEKSLRQYNGRGAYNEWTFVAVQRTLQAGTGAAGALTPGGAAGRGGRAGDRGTGPGSGPARPGTGPGGFRPPTGDGRGFRPGGGR
jgi:type II secretory pathway pseudopilin PulG